MSEPRRYTLSSWSEPLSDALSWRAGADVMTCEEMRARIAELEAQRAEMAALRDAAIDAQLAAERALVDLKWKTDADRAVDRALINDLTALVATAEAAIAKMKEQAHEQ